MSYVGFFCCPANPQPRRIKLLKLHLHNDYYRLRFFVLTHMAKPSAESSRVKAIFLLGTSILFRPHKILDELQKLATSFYKSCGVHVLSIRFAPRLVNSLLFLKLIFVLSTLYYIIYLNFSK